MRAGFIFLFLFCAPALAANQAPSWLRELATSKIPDYGGKASAVVLLNEERVSLDKSGRAEAAHRYAVKILTREGKQHAAARKVYIAGTGKVRDLNAWIIHPSGAVRKFGKKETMDVAAAVNDVYNEVRVRVITAEQDADAGAVFGFEALLEDRMLFTQLEWLFQDRLPALLSRFEVSAPPGWRVTGTVYNSPPLPAQVNGASTTWQLRNLAPVKEEEAGPEMTSLVPRLSVNVLPPDGESAGGAGSFRNWAEVSAWLTELNAPAAQQDEPLAVKARALAAAGNQTERIRAIG